MGKSHRITYFTSGKFIGLDPYEKLQLAIVLQAMDDYEYALMGNKVDKVSPEYTIKKCEEFLISEWGDLLTVGCGKQIIKNMRKKVGSNGRRKEF